jgi:hypothetical protein
MSQLLAANAQDEQTVTTYVPAQIAAIVTLRDGRG